MSRKIIGILVCFSILHFSCEKSESSRVTMSDKNRGLTGEFKDEWTYSVNAYGNFDLAEFRLWVPDSIIDIRAVLVLSNSYNGSALAFSGKEYWQDFARQERLALLGVNFKSYAEIQKDYPDARGGSGMALVSALDTIAKKNNLNELGELPMLLRGYSAGGVFSYFFSVFLPERVLAFANIRGGTVITTKSSNIDIPGMFLIGEEDHPSRATQMKKVVLNKRQEGARWCFAVEPGADHYESQEKSDELIKKFFSKVLKERLVDGSSQLQSIPENKGWLGNNVSREIYHFDAYNEPKDNASWLIDESFAIAWKAYQKD